METEIELKEFLESKGFRIGEKSPFDTSLWTAFKIYDTKETRECVCNEKAPQINVLFYRLDMSQFPNYQGDKKFREDVTIKIVNESDLGWQEFTTYGLSIGQMEDLDKYVEALIRAWEASWDL